MRILVHEFVSGGGLAGQDAPASLVREGTAMRDALIADLAALGLHQIVATVDSRFPLTPPSGVRAAVLFPGPGGARKLNALIAAAEAAWIVAPETGGALEKLAARVEGHGTALLGSGSATIRRAADKGLLARRLARRGLPHPPTRVLPVSASRDRWMTAAREVGYPVVVKPRRGAGCEGVHVASDARGLRRAVARARQVDPSAPLLVQRFVPGVAASVSLLGNGRRSVALTVNSQGIRHTRGFRYDGGTTPLDHPLAGLAAETAVRACDALFGIRGYAGVDLILTDSEAVVIEVNPRLTTAYLGVRAATAGAANVAGLAIDACRGVLPADSAISHRVRFTAAGTVVSVMPLRGAAPGPGALPFPR